MMLMLSVLYVASHLLQQFSQSAMLCALLLQLAHSMDLITPYATHSFGCKCSVQSVTPTTASLIMFTCTCICLR
jgi:hypothetical protein